MGSYSEHVRIFFRGNQTIDNRLLTAECLLAHCCHLRVALPIYILNVVNREPLLPAGLHPSRFCVECEADPWRQESADRTDLVGDKAFGLEVCATVTKIFAWANKPFNMEGYQTSFGKAVCEWKLGGLNQTLRCRWSATWPENRIHCRKIGFIGANPWC